MDGFVIPRCQHGHIILGCRHDDCPEQVAYLQEQQWALDKFYIWQRVETRRIVREMLGLPIDDARVKGK